MNILIVGGRKKADFLATSLLQKHHRVTIIHDERDYADFLARKHTDATVIYGEGSQPYVLEDANVRTADAVIALTPVDADNLAICQLAKNVFNVKRAFTTVNNPKNVDVFKRLGINSVISGTYIVAQMIEQMAAVSEIASIMSIEQGRIMVMEITVGPKYPVVNRALADIDMPAASIIGCIVRDVQSIIPKGDTIIQAHDKLVILSTQEVQDDVVKVVSGKTNR